MFVRYLHVTDVIHKIFTAASGNLPKKLFTHSLRNVDYILVLNISGVIESLSRNKTQRRFLNNSLSNCSWK